MPSPFPGMDPFLEKNPIFHELHTQMLALMQGHLQPQLRPKYIAPLERHLSEGSIWDADQGMLSLDRKEPDVTVVSRDGVEPSGSTATLATPAASADEQFDEDELQLRRQRRIVIYVNARPRMAVAGIELLSPSNKQPGSVGQTRYLEKRSSALRGGLHWIEIDLLRGGQRPPLRVTPPAGADYLAYVAQATATGWRHLVYPWTLREPLPHIPIPLVGDDQASVDLQACFSEAYDRIAAEEEAGYSDPPPAALRPEDAAGVDTLLREKGLRS